ncbi:hypothetical protein [uncultured Clostridium sp.]|uniref:hypothetical protein n=1 Tax=uncultured Clostridium sp. TaxID=59620 RepID=UPI0026003A8B|nr:hypothetical protein [uncultured Clostridium sp.]
MLDFIFIEEIASVAITNEALKTAAWRIVFVFIGIIISLIGNKLIFSDYEQDKFKKNNI